MKTTLKILLSTAFFGLIACSSEKQVPSVATPEALMLPKGNPMEIAEIAKANNAFALDIFKTLCKTNEGNSFFISPFSISAALAMTYAGAKKETEQEMSKVLHWPQNSEAMHQGFGDLMKKMNGSDKEFTLNVANRLYLQEDLKLYKQFAEINDQKYGAAVQSIDFNKNDEAAKKINSWVADKTQKMIPELLKPDVLAGARLVLVNAVYFYGGWANKFNEESTAKDKFYKTAENAVDIDFMNKNWSSDDEESKHPYSYTEDSLFQILNLPYAEDKGSMVVFLPKKGGNLDTLIAQLAPESLQQYLTALDRVPDRLILKLPKWEQRSQYNLKDPLKKMGLISPFEDIADFSGISPDVALKISAIIHEAVVEVSEKGTKAAASTAVVTKETSAAINEEPQIIEFIADHPFFYLIKDKETGSILFMGRFI